MDTCVPWPLLGFHHYMFDHGNLKKQVQMSVAILVSMIHIFILTLTDLGYHSIQNR